MSAGVYDFTILKTETFKRTFTYKPDGTNVINLTGYSSAMKIKSLDGTLLCDVTVGGSITLGGAAGTIAVVIPYSIVSAWAAGNYRYDLVLIEPDNERVTILKGDVVVEAGET